MDFINYKIEDIIISIKSGKTPSTKEKLYFEGDIPWITTSDLKGQKLLEKTEKNISNLALVENQAFLFEENTVILSTIGEIGKACLINKPMACNQQLTGIKLNSKIILSDIFYYWIVKNKDLLSFKANKSVISILNNKSLKKLKISFPEKIEDQNKVRAQLDQIQELIDIKIESIKVLDDLIRSYFFELFGDPIKNNKNHKKISLSNKKIILNSGFTPTRTNPNYFYGSIPWAKSTDVKGEFIYKTEENISSDAISFTGAKVFPKGSILLAMYGQGKTRGRVALLGVDASCNQACAVINSKEFSNIFLFSVFKYSYDYLRTLSKGGGRDNLSLEILKRVTIINPRMDLQLKYESLYNKINEQKNILKQSLEILKTLFHSVLIKSFEENVIIREELIFEELIKNFTLDDLKNKKSRLKSLINLFSESKLNNIESYNDAKDKLFELLDEEVLEQSFDGDNIKIDVK